MRKLDSLLATLLEHFSPKTELCRNRRIQLSSSLPWLLHPMPWKVDEGTHLMSGGWHLHNISFSQHGTLENAHYSITAHPKLIFPPQQMGASIHDFTETVLSEMVLLLAQYSGLSMFLSSILGFAGERFLLVCCNSFEYSPRHTENGFFTNLGHFNRCFSWIEICPTTCTNVTELPKIRTPNASRV